MFATVTEKLGSSFIASASSFKVSRTAGALFTRSLILESTKSVDAINLPSTVAPASKLRAPALEDMVVLPRIILFPLKYRSLNLLVGLPRLNSTSSLGTIDPVTASCIAALRSIAS